MSFENGVALLSRPVTSSVLAVISALVLVTLASGVDRTACYLPLSINAGTPHDSRPAPPDGAADAAIARSGVLPTEALGIGENSATADAHWRRYLELWRGHHEAPDSAAIRRWLTLPQRDEVQMTIRRGRVSPKFLPWRAGSFAVVQTPHFEILSRADEDSTQAIARDLERLYWVWTQLYFPLWIGRDQVAIGLADWNPASSSIDDFLSQNASSRLSNRQRHRVVLLPDEKIYQLTISHPQIAAGRPATIAASTGFYSDALLTSFFFPDQDRSGLAHEICHQLFEEATDRQRTGRTSTNAAVTSATHDFWLVEGIAGHFESIQIGERLASIGGWDSSRLQYSRYQTLIAGQAISTIDQLRGNRREVQRRSDLASWYSQSILHTHGAVDATSPPTSRAQVLRLLADIYRVDVSDFASLRAPAEAPLQPNSRLDQFLKIDDAHLLAHPIPGTATAICLAGCAITDIGWATLPVLPQVRWFDASRTPISDAQVQRLLAEAEQLEQLSLEATKITASIGRSIARATRLRELDLSWTAIDDSAVDSLTACPDLETLWLTGTGLSDAAIETLLTFKKLKTIDVQRTQISEAGLQRLRAARAELEINPLQIPGQ